MKKEVIDRYLGLHPGPDCYVTSVKIFILLLHIITKCKINMQDLQELSYPGVFPMPIHKQYKYMKSIDDIFFYVHQRWTLLCTQYKNMAVSKKHHIFIGMNCKNVLKYVLLVLHLDIPTNFCLLNYTL